MNQWEDIISFTNGTVDLSNIESCSFEFVRDLYTQIKELLQERVVNNVPEASTFIGEQR